MTEPSIENLKAVAEELKKTGVRELRKENLIEGDPSINSGSSRVESRDEKTPATSSLSDLIQEKMKLEKILQELNNLKSKICQRIGLIKTIMKDNDSSDQIKKRFESLKENIK